ncbi:hypothetical protein VB715_17545 [Crocosphaera sp. UHCC 0190]|uniref:hypothetical protein n=1 Tax=Crocosphaera sp. UHCC 0190 TaxID=3110246 RepID=UPI002B1EBA60|nr:hypothetical protein [Crocosphaera sp. UHCC 0190]MEA5511581.1 hypothetical protein [Crocosphaera sp. UHCC 0190]
MKVYSVVLLTLSSLLIMSPFTTHKAQASCAMTDVSFQVAIRGSRTPSQQTNNVGMGTMGDCWGNATTNTSTQVYTGAGTVQQGRNSSHLVGGSQPLPYGVTGPVIGTQISVPVDIYSPAHDPNFINNTLGTGFHH